LTRDLADRPKHGYEKERKEFRSGQASIDNYSELSPCFIIPELRVREQKFIPPPLDSLLVRLVALQNLISHKGRGFLFALLGKM